MTSHALRLPEPEFKPANLVEMLRWRGMNQPDRLGYEFVVDGEAEEVRLTYHQLDQKALAVATLLQSAGATGQRVLLLYPPGLDFVIAFFGCLYAGAIAVPVYPPHRNRNLGRLAAIARDAQPTLLLTTAQYHSAVQSFCEQNQELKTLSSVVTTGLVDVPTDCWRKPLISESTLAFLQYTSGATGNPRGVMVSHGNLIHNSTLLQQAFGYDSNSYCVSWLPVYHDMGLIGGVLQPLFGGYPCTLMSPASFLRRPVSWLRAISRQRNVISGAPDFAYRLCVSKISSEERIDLDLSDWRVAFNGAEPIRYETLKEFTATFESCGFRPEAFYPCYGLAESTLIVSGGQRGRAPVIKTVVAKALENKRWIESEEQNNGTGRTLVASGRTLLDQQIVIANLDSLTRCEPDEVGEIWVSGQSVAKGYWNRPQETAHAFMAHLADTAEGPFLRTGDLGVARDGELFVVGRLKDLIIIRGLNHYPQDIESTVERCHAGFQPNGVAAFSVEVAGEERLVVALEIRPRNYAESEDLIRLIRQEVAEIHDVLVYAVSLVRTGSIPKTSSGKIQRYACRTSFLNDDLRIVKEWRDTGIGESDTPLSLLKRPLSTQAAVEIWLVSHLADKLKIAHTEVDTSQPIIRYGLDSLKAIELMHSIEATLSVNLPVPSLLQSPSIAELASQILRELEAPSRHSTEAAYLKPTHLQVLKHPLSRGQQALWFLNQLSPDSSTYNISGALAVHGDLNVAALRAAFQSLVDRHPALRTSFIACQGELLQHINGKEEVAFHEEDIKEWDQEQIDRRLAEESNRCFRLETGPLFRVHLFTRAREDYVILLVMHHIISDYWSMALLAKELGLMYRAALEEMPPALAPLTLQYTDYARWEAEILGGAEGERLASYWVKQLAGEIPILNMPADRSRPPVQTHRGAALQFTLGRKLTEDLKALAVSRTATLYVTLMAAFELLLSRHTGQSDLLIGSPTTGRMWAEVAGVVGYFVNTVVIRADLSRPQMFTEFLEQVRHTVLAALEHQAYPFAALVERLQPERTMSRQPLVQVLFAFENTPAVSVELAGMTVTPCEIETQVVQFDLVLRLTDMGGELKGRLEYSTELFDEATVIRLLSQFKTLLEGITSHPEARLSEFSLLTESERRQLLVEWNQTQAEFAAPYCVHLMFETQVELTPEATALVFEDERLTYRDLNCRANQLAHFLQQRGVGPETLVGVLMERSVEMVVGLLAVLKAGGAYLPLDTLLPTERLSFMMEDTGAAVLLTQRALVEKLPVESAIVVALDAAWDDLGRHSEENVRSKVQAENLAYVIYTSGSTGVPKGAMNTHHAISNRLLWMQQRYHLTSSDRVLQKTPYSFDVSVWEFFWPLINGGRLVLARSGGQQDPAYLLNQIEGQEITIVHFVPSMLQLFLDQPDIQRKCRSLRHVICSGEALTAQLQERYFAQLGAQLHNLYGPTEAAVDVTSWQCDPKRSTSAGVPIGRPIANVEVFVLGTEMDVVPIGVIGELYLGGQCVGRGYLQRPELTAERFVPHPYGRDGGERLYRTGDLVRYLADGNLDYIGRSDQQVKIRGNRIELGEVEVVLEKHEAVAEAVVEAHDEDGQKRLVAYVVAVKEAAPEVTELRTFLQERLPAYMIPSAFVLLPQWPLTANGKLDRKALPAPDKNRPALGREFVAPRTTLEKVLTDLWIDVLKVDQVGVNDNFFELGGDSIRAALLFNRLQEQSGEVIPLRMIFDKPEVSALAAYLKQSHPQAVANLTRGRIAARSATNPEPARPLVDLHKAPPIQPIFQQSEVEQVLATIAQLSDAEVDLMVQSALSEAN
jgi:amino acid adenylation domain-containing protein